jgi:hypothetical protein
MMCTSSHDVKKSSNVFAVVVEPAVYFNRLCNCFLNKICNFPPPPGEVFILQRDCKCYNQKPLESSLFLISHESKSRSETETGHKEKDVQKSERFVSLALFCNTKN